MALIDKPERARQLARAIASDLTLYHEQKILQGIERDTLFDVIRDEIEEGRTLYKGRVTPEIYGLNLYELARVAVLLNCAGHATACTWPPRGGASSGETRSAIGLMALWPRRELASFTARPHC